MRSCVLVERPSQLLQQSWCFERFEFSSCAAAFVCVVSCGARNDVEHVLVVFVCGHCFPADALTYSLR